MTATPSVGSTIHRNSSPAFTRRIATIGLGAPSLRNSGSRCAASTSARPDNVSDGPVFTGGKAIESASNPSVDQPITSNGVTDQRIAISVTAAQFLWSAMAELATATGATVLLTHHMRKDGMLRIADGDDAREAIRGTTALVDGARLAYALWKLDDENARSICNTLQVPFERGRIVRGAVVKANDEADHNAHTYTREESGLLVQLETEPNAPAEGDFTMAQAREVLKEIDRRFKEGSPFSHAPQAGSRYLGHYLVRQYGMSRTAAAALIADWLNNGVIGIDVIDRKSKLTGLKVLTWL